MSTLLSSPHIDDATQRSGDYCCGCSGAAGDCCKRTLIGGEACCFRVGQRGTMRRNRRNISYLLCCTNGRFCDPPQEPDFGCIRSDCTGNVTEWDVQIIFCGLVGDPDNNFIALILIPTGGQAECGYPMIFFSGIWHSLDPSCGMCLPCGPFDPCVLVECTTDCACKSLSMLGCCEEGDDPAGGLCSIGPDGVQAENRCDGFTLDCFNHIPKCIDDDDGCIPDCKYGVLYATITLTLDEPECRFCLETVDGQSRCVDDEDYDVVCLDQPPIPPDPGPIPGPIPDPPPGPGDPPPFGPAPPTLPRPPDIG